MSALSRLVEALRTDPLDRRAALVVSAGTALGVQCFLPYAERHEQVLQVPTEHWDWVFTVAGFYVAVARLRHTPIAPKRKERLVKVMADAFVRWKPDAMEAFSDCRTFCDRTMETLSEVDFYRQNPHLVAQDAIGRWMSWNAFGRAPESDEEQLLARAMGAACVSGFAGWWDETPS